MVSDGERRPETTGEVICGREGEAADTAVIEKGGKWPFLLGVLMIAAYILGACGFRGSASGDNKEEYGREAGRRNGEVSSELSYTGSMELRFATGFFVDYYEGGYRLIGTEEGRRYLVIPKGARAPEDLAEDIAELKQPLTNVYLVATAAMDMVCELDGLDLIGFSGQRAEGWSVEEARRGMEEGRILYAGRYDSPDYELIVSRGCSLAVENNMITHCPEVREKLESFGIPVLVDSSSYESHPLGRVEWIKLYGVLLGREEEAREAFDRQAEALGRVAGQVASGKTVAFFYITANGMVSVRASSDYIPAIIRLAGGKYVFEDLGKEGGRSTVTMQLEEFYHQAKEADFLVYNSAIDGEMESLEELIQREELLRDFKAVRQGNVWCTDRDLYQRSMSAGQLLEDIYNMLSEERDRQEETVYLHRLRNGEGQDGEP